jgi:hypothetical protein
MATWVDVRGKKIAPQQVSAEILRKMKTAEDYGERSPRRDASGVPTTQRQGLDADASPVST